MRPILLLRQNSFGDYLYLPLTTNLDKSKRGVVIDNTHLSEGFLPQTSIVVYEKIGVIAQSLLIKKIGQLDTTTYEQVFNKLVAFIQSPPLAYFAEQE